MPNSIARPFCGVQRVVRGLLLFALATAVAPASFPQAVQTIVLGPSATALTGPWKFAPGDSPVVDGALLWAQPDFDDSRWDTMDLTTAADGRAGCGLRYCRSAPGR